jgi:hypothetical protein
MTNKKIVLVSGDDWKSLYVDGKLKVEGHYISAKRIIEALDIECDFLQVDQTWLEDRGNLPKELEDIPKEMLKDFRGN